MLVCVLYIMTVLTDLSAAVSVKGVMGGWSNCCWDRSHKLGFLLPRAVTEMLPGTCCMPWMEYGSWQVICQCALGHPMELVHAAKFWSGVVRDVCRLVGSFTRCVRNPSAYD